MTLFFYQDRKVAIVITHQEFDPKTFENDLALLRFHEPVIFQPNIIPVCIPQVKNLSFPKQLFMPCDFHLSQ